MTKPLSTNSPWRDGKLDELERVYAAYLDAGFPVTLQGNPERLQAASAENRTDWLTLLGACDDAVKAGQGSDPIAVPIRCLSNNAYTITNAGAAELMRDLRAWGVGGKLNLWRLKDLIRAAPTRDALTAIDLQEGWP